MKSTFRGEDHLWTQLLFVATEIRPLIPRWAPVELSLLRGTEGQAQEGTISTMSCDFLDTPAKWTRIRLCLQGPLPREGKALCTRKHVF